MAQFICEQYDCMVEILSMCDDSTVYKVCCTSNRARHMYTSLFYKLMCTRMYGSWNLGDLCEDHEKSWKVLKEALDFAAYANFRATHLSLCDICENYSGREAHVEMLHRRKNKTVIVSTLEEEPIGVKLRSGDIQYTLDTKELFVCDSHGNKAHAAGFSYKEERLCSLRSSAFLPIALDRERVALYADRKALKCVGDHILFTCEGLTYVSEPYVTSSIATDTIALFWCHVSGESRLYHTYVQPNNMRNVFQEKC